MLPHALHAFAHQFSVCGCDTAHHVLHIGVVEHCSVHDTSSWNVIESRARDLFSVNQDIVSPTCFGLNTQFSQRICHHFEVTTEGETHIIVFRYVGKHHVTHISIDTSASAFTPECLNVMLSTVV